MRTMEKKTTAKEQHIAEAVNDKIQQSLLYITEKENGTIEISIGHGQFLTVPVKAIVLLSEIVDNMAEGKSNTLFTNDSELTTQEAADLLNVSRTYLIKLLDQKQLPYRTLGKHRRIRLDDLNLYKDNMQMEREKQLQFLADQSQDLNLDF